MVDLVAAAYGVENDYVMGGPSWLERDRFDVIAKAPAGTSKENVRLMLQAMLAERFKLAVHNDTKAMPAYVLTVGKGKPRIKESDESSPAGCGPGPKLPDPPQGGVGYVSVTCHNMTMEKFAENLRQMAGNYLTSPVVDQTGLKGFWDIDIKWTGRGNLQKAGADGISIFDAVDKQLGMKLEMQKAPLPVLVVDSVNEKPTPNAPSVATSLPAPPPPAFEVAVIKPSKPGETNLQGRINGGQVDVKNAPLKFLISFAWDLNQNSDEMIADAPKWLNEDRFDILGKASSEMSAKGMQIDFDDLRLMVQTLLEDRFKLKTHREDRPVNAYTLVAVSPKLKKADPEMRTGCKEGPGPDGKDPRIASPVLNRLVTCQNMTMADFAQELTNLAPGYIKTPVVDATGIEGRYDFTLSFSSADLTRASAGGGGAGGGAGGGTGGAGGAAAGSSDPNGALSLIDAVNKQMGLKLEKVKRPVSVLVIDHIDEKPTDN